MPLLHCEECLSRLGVLVLVWPDERACRRCGHAPVVQLSPNEIRACLGIEVRSKGESR